MESLVLPPVVRRTLVELAAEVLGTLTEPDVPAGLRKVRGFAPARRARAGAAPLAMALEREPGFRRLVAAAWRTTDPDLAAVLERDEVPPTVAPELVVVGLYLTRPEGWEAGLARWLAAITADHQDAEQRDRLDGTAARLAALASDLEQARAELNAAAIARAELVEEIASLRREQRKLRSDADRARSAARESERRSVEESARLSALLAERDDLLRQAQSRAAEAQEQVASTRRAAKDGRSLAELRTRLLLDTIVESASALRRELALPPAAQAPADLIDGQLAAGRPRAGEPTAPVVAARGLAGDDPALVAELLRIPRAHLVVDGYNVTMEGYGGLPLVDQRRLLIDALSGLAARTSAEVTCCFDGAQVDGRAQGLVRGVRVLFSDPGTTADELIRRLIRAEPAGRMLVVVSSDREVADSAVAAGARAVPSVGLLRLLGTGLRERRR